MGVACRWFELEDGALETVGDTVEMGVAGAFVGLHLEMESPKVTGLAGGLKDCGASTDQYQV